jgi:hypothetical protein
VIEHLEEQQKYLAEVARVLKDDGLFFVSTPNRAVYRQGLKPNPFHVREFDLAEFRAILGARFPRVTVLAQSYVTGISIGPAEGEASTGRRLVDFDRLLAPAAGEAEAPQHPYFIAVCSRAGDVGATGVTRLFQCSHATGQGEESWVRRLYRAVQDLGLLVAPNVPFILVDEDQFGSDFATGRRRIPFPERDGQYWGPPESTESAISEVERLRDRGARFMVFGWPAFWWLDHYAGLHEHLRSRYPCTFESDDLKVFDLRP